MGNFRDSYYGMEYGGATLKAFAVCLVSRYYAGGEGSCKRWLVRVDGNKRAKYMVHSEALDPSLFGDIKTEVDGVERAWSTDMVIVAPMIESRDGAAGKRPDKFYLPSEDRGWRN